MAIFGHQNPELAYMSINDYMRGSRYIMGAIDGIADSMTVQIEYMGLGVPKLKMAIYNTDATLVGVTGEVNVPYSWPYRWITATFSAPKPELTANTWCYLEAISNELGVGLGWIGVFPPVERGRIDAIAYEDAFEDPATWNADGNMYSIYCTYTEIPYVHHLGKGTMYTP